VGAIAGTARSYGANRRLWERLFGQEDLMSRSTWMCESDEPRQGQREKRRIRL